MVEEQQPWAACGRRGRSCSRGGGAATCSNLGRPAGGRAGAAPGVEEQLAAATLGGLREEGQELLQGWRSSQLQQPWPACGRRGRSCSRGGGAASRSNLGQPAGGGAGAAPGVEKWLTTAIFGGSSRGGRSCSRGGGAANRSDLGRPAEGQELLQWWRSSNPGRPMGGGAGAAPAVAEQLTAATLSSLREGGQDLLQGWRSS